MFEIVMQRLADTPKCNFPQYFLQYVMSIQDSNIDSEFSYLLRHNTLDILNLDRLITDHLDRLVKHDKF